MRCALLGLLSPLLFSVSPVSIIETKAVNNQQVLFAEDGIAITKVANAADKDFADLYVVRTPGWFALPHWLTDAGEVIAEAKGKFAVMRLRKVAQVSGMLHGANHACGTVFRLFGDTVEVKAPTVPTPILPVEQSLSAVTDMIADVDPTAIQATIEELSAIETRYHSTPTGRNVVDFLMTKYRALAGDRTDVSVEAFDHTGSTVQRSLVVRILGQQFPDQIIVLGSHIDSVNWEDGSRMRAPGVDDNASGTATNLEVFRQLMQSGVRLARTLEIHGYAAEEIGLVGSQDMASKYSDADKNVVAMMQIDMDLYKPAGTADKIWFVTNGTNATLNGQLRTLAGHYSGVEIGEGRLTAGSSDHASWTRQGVAASFPFEHPTDHNPHIHTADDSLENATAYGQAAAFAKLGVGFAVHFAGIAAK